PPGHHAMKSTYCGYCFYNNVALAADHALKNGHATKILIVDWDVHHGQATQQMFYDDNRVLYFSIHRFEYGTFWPNLRESDYDHVGEGIGLGYNFNVPLNKIGFGNSEYLTIFHELLLPVAVEYDPDLVIISSGYDAAIGCPEFEPNLVLVSGGYDAAVGDEKGLMKVEPACYAHFVNSLKALANGKLAVVLEGGYFLKSLAEGAALTLRALLGDPCPNIDPTNKPDD
ncbi:Histone deacetylase domain, partial [Sarracenia purpurea var. burkii]